MAPASREAARQWVSAAAADGGAWPTPPDNPAGCGADLIIAKGQGNFETLSEAPGNIYFLFKVKCPVIAARTGLPEGAQVLARKPTKKDTARSPAGWA